MNAIVTVVGQDRVGIIAAVCVLLAENNVNILDISQTILQGSFTMVMAVDVEKATVSVGDLRTALEQLGEKLLNITIGNPYVNPHVNRPFAAGGYDIDEHPLEGVARMLKGIAQLKAAVPELKIIASSEKAGVYAVMNKGGRQIFVTGHSEYDQDTLNREYLRDKSLGLPIHVPENYFPDDDETKDPIVRWRSHGNLLFSNWLNYFVYQTTPYDIMTIGGETVPEYGNSTNG